MFTEGDTVKLSEKHLTKGECEGYNQSTRGQVVKTTPTHLLVDITGKIIGPCWYPREWWEPEAKDTYHNALAALGE